MNPFDLIVVVLMIVLGVVGAVWGISRMAAGLAGLVLAFFLALRLAHHGPAWFDGWIDGPEWAGLAAFFVVFVGVMIGAVVSAWLLRRFLRALMLGWADRLAGAAAGVVGALLLGAALTLPLTALAPPEEPLLADSLLAPWTLHAADVVVALVPEDLERQYAQKKAALRLAWEEAAAGAATDTVRRDDGRP